MSIEPVRRKRAFLPKVKTGCKTCKFRKVKCGEEKPFCRRCTSTGRECAGYASKETSRSPAVQRASPRSVSRSKAPPIQRQVSQCGDWFGTDRERRSFHFFLTHAGLQLGGYFQTPFWTREVMQAAIYYPSIRHLVVALGSAYEHFEGRQTDPTQMEFALQQSNESIRHLTQQTSPFASLTRQSVESSSTLITASLMFTILSSMQGHVSDALDHIRAGLRVLQNLEYEQAGLDDNSSTSSGQSNHNEQCSPAYPVPLARLRSLLTTLYLQYRVMVSAEDSSAWLKDPLAAHIEYSTCFTTLEEAKEHVDSLFGSQISFFQQTSLRYPLTDEEIAATQAYNDSLLYGLQCSREALDAFVARRSLETTPEDDASIKVLRLYHLYLEIRMGVGVLHEDVREFAFDEWEPHFERMLGYCRELLDTSDTLRPTYSSGLGIVIPLHMIGHRCRNASIRSEAVELLLKASRREGLWDSGVVGRIAATTSQLEQDESILQQWRVRDVKTHFTDEGRASLVFIAGDNDPANQGSYFREIDFR